MSVPTSYEVNFSLLVQPRSDSTLGSGRSDLQNMTTVVRAAHQGQAQALVESQYGGSAYCIVHAVRPIW